MPVTTASSRKFAPRKFTPNTDGKPKDHPILFQTYFKSVGPRTYAAQIKQADNGNQFLVLTEGSRKKDSEELRKTRIFVFSEDFEAFLNLIRQTADFVRQHPVDEKVRRRQMAFWKRKNEQVADENPAAPGLSRPTAPTALQAGREADQGSRM